MTSKVRQISKMKWLEDLKNVKEDVWLLGGTLLGAVRDGDFIDNDTDIDLGMMYDEGSYDKIYQSEIPINIQKFIRIGDKYYHPHKLHGDFWTLQTPLSGEFVKVKIQGVEFKAPKEYEELLSDWYSDWKTPMPQPQRFREVKLNNYTFENEY